MAHTFERSCTLPYPREVVFNWHTRPGAFERLNPPWRPVRILESSHSIQNGARVKIKLPVLGPVGLPWLLEHTNYIDQSQFCDEQISGPFASWRHLHRFVATNDHETTLADTITYELPRYIQPLTPVIKPLLERELHRLFAFRHAALAADLQLLSRFKDKPRLKFLVTGASGLIGSALCSYLSTAGHCVVRLVRHAPRNENEYFWDPAHNQIDANAFNGIDVVVHLAGENIAARRWSAQQKAELRESRVLTSRLLAHAISSLSVQPKVFLAASGVGIYGDTGGSVADEKYPSGEGFLSDLAREWESSYAQLCTCMRVVSLRFGTVLSARGGALRKMLPAFQAGVGGSLGSGKQWMSWIALQDVIGAIEHAAYTSTLSGPVNVTAPASCSNREFTKTLGRVLKRPTMFPVPAPVLRILFGELADALLLSNSRIVPTKLLESGYVFSLPTLEAALRAAM